MIGFPVALIFANGVEWYAHKYILHGTPRPGKPRYSPVPKSMKSHWQHHAERAEKASEVKEKWRDAPHVHGEWVQDLLWK